MTNPADGAVVIGHLSLVIGHLLVIGAWSLGLPEPAHLPRQHFLYFFPLPHGHGSFRPTFGAVLRTEASACWTAAPPRWPPPPRRPPPAPTRPVGTWIE